MTMRRVTTFGIVALLALAATMVASASWIHAKALLAQLLLQRAWSESGQGRLTLKPWPWADVAPIANLRVPRLHEDLIVLDSDSGQALAFGPGWTSTSAVPGTPGLSVISAHRDTQFAFLRKLRRGDTINLTGAHGTREYRVTSTQVVDSHRFRPAADGTDALLLVTCYPFDAIVPGGPLRYVVEARPRRTLAAR